ncbi:DUF3616 domain-containing protein [Belnapia sp. T18]|uniref:DUF3616 domain-containing protein n=1 Tax=Belnapia arida TaxID=2804533 RepID=A0ABS1UDJ8_9PROT|nr:DUF3616 domain-containing protein [Belnapia arida]MBL6082774.1 DUF3616 domain-containing protein [Belnapia arida]
MPDGFGEFLVWNDENETTLRVSLAGNTMPVTPPDDVSDSVRSALRARSGRGEADLEGAARLGDRIYLIGSHGRNSSGERRERREQLIALEVAAKGDEALVRQVPETRVYGELISALREQIGLLGPVLGPNGDARDAMRAPERSGLNIEGLTADPDGGTLLIGLRSPLTSDGHAIVVPLSNPGEVVALAGTRARLGEPIPLDLDNRGVRSLERMPDGSGYLVLAGPTGDGPGFELFAWAGPGSQEVAKLSGFTEALHRLPDFRPEGMVVHPAGTELLLISDDGGRLVGFNACKDAPPEQRSFRMLRLPLRAG